MNRRSFFAAIPGLALLGKLSPKGLFSTGGEIGPVCKTMNPDWWDGLGRQAFYMEDTLPSWPSILEPHQWPKGMGDVQ